MTTRSYYERKRGALDRCPDCNATAVMAQVTWDGTERTRYHAICTRKTCSRHRTSSAVIPQKSAQQMHGMGERNGRRTCMES